MRKSLWVACAVALGLSTAGTAGAQPTDTDPRVAAARAADQAYEYDEARRLWLPLAEEGMAEAQYRLGYLFYDGRGACESKPLGFQWLAKAAEQGHIPAERLVGEAYESGRGVARDRHQAISWLQKAAEKGDVKAQVDLGYLYGSGDDADYEKAGHWFQKAAEQGDYRAPYQLGRLYDGGPGLPEDFTKAAHWYGVGADNGDGFAQKELARLYENGLGMTRDYSQAYKWYVLANTSGSFGSTESDKAEMEALKARMTPAEIAEAEGLITEARTKFGDHKGYGPPSIIRDTKPVCK